MGNSVNVEMPLLLLLLLVLPLSNRASSRPSGLEEAVKEEEKSEKLNDIDKQVEKLIQRMERMDILEKKLEIKNVEVENLQQQVKEGELQFESRVKELILMTKKKNHQEEIASLKSELTMQNADLQNQCKAEVKKELDKVLPTAVEQGLRDLPFEMVCAYQDLWTAANSIVNYDRITVEFNNSDRPGGGDGSMNIETGVFTTVTSGYYIVTFSGYVVLNFGETTDMWLGHNGVQVEESFLHAKCGLGSGDEFIYDQASRTVILHLLAGDTLDLRTTDNRLPLSGSVYHLTLCLYRAPAPYGL